MAKRRTVTDNINPLLHRFDEETKSARTARWFSNPLFENITKTAAGEADQAEEADEEPSGA
eukprot:scaffold14295_cov76-Amphora_coffeaeformis.AAC.1